MHTTCQFYCFLYFERAEPHQLLVGCPPSFSRLFGRIGTILCMRDDDWLLLALDDPRLTTLKHLYDFAKANIFPRQGVHGGHPECKDFIDSVDALEVLRMGLGDELPISLGVALVRSIRANAGARSQLLRYQLAWCHGCHCTISRVHWLHQHEANRAIGVSCLKCTLMVRLPRYHPMFAIIQHNSSPRLLGPFFEWYDLPSRFHALAREHDDRCVDDLRLGVPAVRGGAGARILAIIDSSYDPTQKNIAVFLPCPHCSGHPTVLHILSALPIADRFNVGVRHVSGERSLCQ